MRLSSTFVPLLLSVGWFGCAGKPVQDTAMRDVLQMRYQMAETLVKKRAYDSAAPYLMDLVARRPKDARLHLLLGIVLRDKGVYKKAEEELKLALKLQPQNAATENALGVLHLLRRDYNRAHASLRRAVKLASGVASYRNDLGFCLLAQRKLEEAQAELLEAVKLNPSNRRAFNNLGITLGLLGREAEAMQAFNQVGGSRAMALTNMGYVQELRGRPAAARRFYERALRINADYEPARRNLKTLDPQSAMVEEQEQNSPTSEEK